LKKRDGNLQDKNLAPTNDASHSREDPSTSVDAKKLEDKLAKKIDKELENKEIFPESLVIFRSLQLNSFYSRHFYVFKYIAKPFLSSACVTIFFNYPWVSVIFLTATFAIDLIFGWKQKIFKTKINNIYLVMENSLFLVISGMYIRILLATSDYDRKLMSVVGWVILA